MSWMPIETAPKDGAKILGFNQVYGQRETYMTKFMEGSPGYERWKSGDGPLNCGWDWHEPKNGWSSTWKPTHWQPLPEPPES